MLISDQKSLEHAISNKEPLPRHTLTYLVERTKDRLHSKIVETFFEEKKSRGLTRAMLAKKIHATPEQITRWLSTPNNMTFATAAKLLAGMGMEIEPTIESIIQKPLSNHKHALVSYREAHKSRTSSSGESGGEFENISAQNRQTTRSGGEAEVVQIYQ